MTLTATDLFCGAGGSSLGAKVAGVTLAMAFPDTYVAAGTKADLVKLWGNAVTPPVMAMLVGRVVEALGA